MPVNSKKYFRPSARRQTLIWHKPNQYRTLMTDSFWPACGLAVCLHAMAPTLYARAAAHASAAGGVADSAPGAGAAFAPVVAAAETVPVDAGARLARSASAVSGSGTW